MKNVLVIDDSRTMREMIEFSLKNKFNITLACDGKEGLTKVTTDKYDCIITDLNMPIMDGIEFISSVRNMKNFTPILMLTTESDNEKKIKGKNAGATGWLVKPFDPEKLINTVNKVVL